MGMAINNGYSSLFNSLNGKYNANADMSNLIGNYSQIKSGSYGKLMKAYVKKVGNGAALDAYRTTGSTAQATDITQSSATASKSSTQSVSAEKSGTKNYASMQSSWLDNHLKHYDESGQKQLNDSASPVAVDTAV